MRKCERPLDTRKPVHLVLKSSHARHAMSFLGAKNRIKILKIIKENARRFHVKIHRFENIGNHLHVVASFPRRENFQNFLRTITSLIARAVTGARKGQPFGKRFWDHLAFTRVIMGHRDLSGIKNYLSKNALEREVGGLSRATVEQYEAAERKARRRGVEVWRILEELGAKLI